MVKIDEELTPEEEARAVLRFALPNLPASIRVAMLAEPAVVTRAGFPLGEFLPLWGRSFRRADILTALRAIANGEGVLLRSYDGKIEVTDPEQLAAWDDYARSKGGSSFPRNSRGGWRLPSPWPPGYKAPGYAASPAPPVLQTMQ